MTQLQPLTPPERVADVSSPPHVVDLRDTATEPLDGRAGNDGQVETTQDAQPRTRRRWIIVLLLLALVAAFFVERRVGEIAHDSRQRHLAYEFGQPVPQVPAGGAMMNLQIPAIGLNEIVAEGASASALRSGPGHVQGTADIGGRGNAVILGRRERYGGPFSKLDTLHKGDQIAVQNRQSQVRLYKVVSVALVPNSSARPVEPTRRERLTLVTSDAGFFPHRRVVVVAEPTSSSRILGKHSNGGPVSSGALDQRPATTALGLLLWLGLAGLVVVLLFAARDLRRRSSTMVALVALAPVALLLSLIFLYSLDIVLASTV
jgi:LPXTG-site transpeptidase (sortase) family protein